MLSETIWPIFLLLPSYLETVFTTDGYCNFELYLTLRMQKYASIPVQPGQDFLAEACEPLNRQDTGSIPAEGKNNY